MNPDDKAKVETELSDAQLDAVSGGTAGLSQSSGPSTAYNASGQGITQDFNVIAADIAAAATPPPPVVINIASPWLEHKF
jgi:hypothetical protein